MIERNDLALKRKKWAVAPCSKDLASQIAEEFSVNPLAALLAASREVAAGDEMGDFFDADAPLAIDPFSIKDMDKAACRINTAIDGFEKIAVFGDYDADGITASALLYSYLETRGANVVRYIPDRIVEGYGLSVEAVEALAEDGVKLIVTVDNGVSAINEVIKAHELGITMIITDHHKVGDTLPDAYAVVDPQRSDCTCGFKSFAGVGVAFELVCALEGGENTDELIEEYGDLVALGTIADVVPLTGENRVLVRRGLEQLNTSPRMGIKSMLFKAGASRKPVTASLAAFTLCPRINAAGRMGSAYKALDLMLCDDEDRADEIAEEIQNMNALRQKTEMSIYSQARKQIEDNPRLMLDKIIVVDGEDWHQGVIGIVAAKLTEDYGKPSVVISRSADHSKGSCRSIEGFSIFDAVQAVSGRLTHFGGHTLAAGIGLETSRIEEFKRAINAYADDIEMPFPMQKIDCRINPRSISLDTLDSLSALEPFGAGNPQPCFGLFGVRLDDFSSISDGKHLRMVISKNGARTGAVYFGMQEYMFPYKRGDIVDLAVNLDRNIYNGDVRVSVIVRNIRPSASDEDAVLSQLRLLERIKYGGELTKREAALALAPRELQVSVFKYIKANPFYEGGIEELCIHIGDDGSRLCAVAVAVEMMLETGILTRESSGVICAADNPAKVSLEQSEICRRIKSFL